MDFILSLLGPKSVDQILSGVTKLLRTLETHATKQYERAEREAAVVNEKLAKIAVQRKDAERASQLAARLGNLIS
jgi:hypothetical protein